MARWRSCDRTLLVLRSAGSSGQTLLRSACWRGFPAYVLAPRPPALVADQTAKSPGAVRHTRPPAPSRVHPYHHYLDPPTSHTTIEDPTRILYFQDCPSVLYIAVYRTVYFPYDRQNARKARKSIRIKQLNLWERFKNIFWTVQTSMTLHWKK